MNQYNSLPDAEALIAQVAEQLQQLIAERQLNNIAIVGIHSGGVWVAERLHQLLAVEEALGSLDISFYRDDYTRIGLNPSVQPSHLPFTTEGRHIILVDDVIMSGRTIRAAMNELFDYGRPDSVTLVTLLDLAGRELPIQPDISGQKLTLATNERIKLNGPEPLRLELQDAK